MFLRYFLPQRVERRKATATSTKIARFDKDLLNTALDRGDVYPNLSRNLCIEENCAVNCSQASPHFTSSTLWGGGGREGGTKMF